MLTTIRVKNLGLVADLTVELQPGYNVITGETGAGKSMLIGALSLVLGERADRTMIRGGAESCTVEAVFDTNVLKQKVAGFLEEKGMEACEGGQLVLKRTLAANGTNRQFINGSPAPLSVLAELGEWLVDFHGPHEHQSLLHPARQLAILDAFGGLEESRLEFAKLVRRRIRLEEEKAGLILDERSYAQQLDLLRFQTREILEAQLQPDEEEKIRIEHQRVANAARLLELSQAVLQTLGEDETSLLAQAGMAGRQLHELGRLDPNAKDLLTTHEQAVELLRDLQSGLSHYADKLELDPDRLQQLEQRLDLMHGLKRKYGSTLAEVIETGRIAQKKLASLEQRETELARINTQLDDLTQTIWRSARALSGNRAKLLPVLSKSAARELADLGFGQSRLEVEMRTLNEPDYRDNPSRAGSHGLDSIEFQFSPNEGEALRPLRAIASSGELSRVMLALKTVLAAQDEVPVLVFDEIDANVGGETAHAIGRKMRQLAKARQVLCITHLPQVAASASAHFVATKSTREGRTVTEILQLDREARVTELARMLGGQSEAARLHARALTDQPEGADKTNAALPHRKQR